MSEHIVGFCRFSFWGRGDWGAYARTKPGSEAETEAMRRTHAALYDEARLEFRFRSFEMLTLASLAAQTNRDFSFVVLSSAAMPAPWRDRLTALCAEQPSIRLIFSEARDVGSALAPVLNELSMGCRVPLIQFRLDDDDCVSTDYIAHLAAAARAMQDYPAFAFSLPRGLVMTRYQGADPQCYEFRRPFHGGGAALRLPKADRSLFAYGHYALMQRFPSLADPRPHGSLQLKFEGHDSRRVVPGSNSGISPITSGDFDQILAKNFPFLNQSDLWSLTSVHAPRPHSEGDLKVIE
ncbi:Putative rhamnosyl transferase [Paracoccus halophilus]|uniref:Putative rhamnosyl transferase n=1 Tax=Paracoccus halophilus TaxID=376733 RepID=A0A1I0U1G2_9RHOB|nr:glycosyltransferase [Paracoccus halophilus]SFA57760.1 Putative rhamnosyl transferase [Paracoccus halophilus]